MEQKKKHITKEAALQKLQAFCAYQERCHSEVMTKLRAFGLYGEAAEDIVNQLVEDNFLNEERFAMAYARGKFRMKSWGKIRIQMELKMRHIPEIFIKKALKAVDSVDEGNPDSLGKGVYLETLERILKQKATEYGDDDPQKREKLYAFALRRGFESEFIGEVLKRLSVKKDEF